MSTRILGLLTILTFFLVRPVAAKAQQLPVPSPSWDVAVTAGSFHGQSIDDARSTYWNHSSTALRASWHHSGEWRLTAGRYWTPHFKTEVEFGATGEGDRYIQRFATVPGSAAPYPYGAQEFVKLRQGSGRITWQFLDNQWIHPYLSAGVSFDEERTRTQVFQPVYYQDPRNPSTRVVITPQPEGPRTAYRTGVVLGGGAKWYVSPRVFIKTGAQLVLSRRGPPTPGRNQSGYGAAPPKWPSATKAGTVSFLAGMGFDF